MNGILTAGGAGDADYTKHWESAEEPLRATERGAEEPEKLPNCVKNRNIAPFHIIQILQQAVQFYISTFNYVHAPHTNMKHMHSYILYSYRHMYISMYDYDMQI
jgi:hypothetical protein